MMREISFHSGRHPAVLALCAADAAIALVSLYLAYALRANVLTRWPRLWSGDVPLMPTYTILLLTSLPLIVCALYVSGAYILPRLSSAFQIFVSVGKACAFATLAVLAMAYALRDMTFSRAIVASYLVIAFALAFLLRLVARRVLFLRRLRGLGLHNAVIVGTGPAARAIAEALRRKPYLGYRVIGFVRMDGERLGDPAIATLGDVQELPRIVDEKVVDAVVFGVSLEEAARCERIIWKLEEVGKTVHLRGDAVGVMLSRTFIGEFEGTPILTLTSTPSDPFATGLKRCIDVVGGLAGLALLSPLLLVAALAVKLTSPGPVFYHQERVGLNGRRFRLFKFRSMVADADARREGLQAHNEASGPVFKMADDPRVTSVGRWIRRFSIDELPQLYNVLRGEMSLVGPRPPLPAEVEQYERWQRRRLSMKPGLTCLWQVNGRSEVDFESWMKLDMEYIDSWSLGLDLKILFKTIPVVVTAKGAR
jgi:exopolysaccharide biosynthesis polyprenyl glycosylphosphotransferase